MFISELLEANMPTWGMLNIVALIFIMVVRNSLGMGSFFEDEGLQTEKLDTIYRAELIRTCLNDTRDSFLAGKWVMIGIMFISFILFFLLIWNAPFISAELRLLLLLSSTIIYFAFGCLFFSDHLFQPIYIILASRILCE